MITIKPFHASEEEETISLLECSILAVKTTSYFHFISLTIPSNQTLDIGIPFPVEKFKGSLLTKQITQILVNKQMTEMRNNLDDEEIQASGCKIFCKIGDALGNSFISKKKF